MERATDRATEEYFNEINTWRNEQVDINMDNEPEGAGQQKPGNKKQQSGVELNEHLGANGYQTSRAEDDE